VERLLLLLLLRLRLRFDSVLQVVLVVRLVPDGRDRLLGEEGGEVDVLCQLQGGQLGLLVLVVLLVPHVGSVLLEDVVVVEAVAGVVVVGLYGVQRLVNTRLQARG